MIRYIKSDTSESNCKFYVDSDGHLYYSQTGKFERETADWNHDRDTYSVYGMWVYSFADYAGEFISRDEFNYRGLKQISESEFNQLFYNILDSYFTYGTDKNGNYYYTDATNDGENHYPYIDQSGPVIYGTPEDREYAIQVEIDWQLNRCRL